MPRFLRNPSELKSIKNISLLRQQMEAQAAAQKAAEQAQAALQQAAQHAVQQHHQMRQQQRPSSSSPESAGAVGATDEEEPTDLTMGEEQKEALRVRERLERERYLAEACGNGGSPSVGGAGALRSSAERKRPASSSSPDEDDHHGRRAGGARPAFDFRHLMPQVSVRENY